MSKCSGHSTIVLVDVLSALECAWERTDRPAGVRIRLSLSDREI